MNIVYEWWEGERFTVPLMFNIKKWRGRKFYSPPMMNIVYWCWEGGKCYSPPYIEWHRKYGGGEKTYISPKYDNNNHKKVNPGGGGVVDGGRDGDGVDTCGGCPIAVGDVMVFRSCP